MAARKKISKKRVVKKKVAKKAARKATKKASKKAPGRKSAVGRELIDTGTNKLFVRRNARGTSFKEVVDVSKSLASDRRRKAKTVARSGQGDRGDRRRSR